MGNFSPVDQDENQETKTVELKLVSFLTIMALLTLVTLLVKLIQILLKWKSVPYKTKIMPFWLLCYKGEAVLSKKICPSYPGLSVHVENTNQLKTKMAFQLPSYWLWKLRS